jgi:hypothetical protein
LRHSRTACFGLCLVDDASVQIGIDGHLLSWHGVEGKARSDLRRTHGAMADDQKLNGDQGQEEDEADDVIPAHHELSKSLDHLAGSRSALIAMQQNAPRARQVERQAKQRKKQYQTGKNRELYRPQNLDRGKQDQYRGSDADSQQQIEHEAGQRNQHDEDHRNRGYRSDPLTGLTQQRFQASLHRVAPMAGFDGLGSVF